MYEFTCQFASFTPPSPEMQQLFGAICGNQAAMVGFARVFAGVTSPAEFFSENNVARIFATAAEAGAGTVLPAEGALAQADRRRGLT